MRIRDFLEPHLDGISRVIERHSGALSLEPYLVFPRASPMNARANRLAAGAAQRDSTTTANPTSSCSGCLGPDAERFGREDEALALLAGLGTGQRCAIVFGYPTPALPCICCSTLWPPPGLSWSSCHRSNINISTPPQWPCRWATR